MKNPENVCRVEYRDGDFRLGGWGFRQNCAEFRRILRMSDAKISLYTLIYTNIHFKHFHCKSAGSWPAKCSWSIGGRGGFWGGSLLCHENIQQHKSS